MPVLKSQEMVRKVPEFFGNRVTSQQLGYVVWMQQHSKLFLIKVTYQRCTTIINIKDAAHSVLLSDLFPSTPFLLKTIDGADGVRSVFLSLCLYETQKTLDSWNPQDKM